PVKLSPMAASRELVQVVLRDSTSISPDCSAVKRSLAVSGLNLALSASRTTAAATARQTSTSIPLYWPLASVYEKPGKPSLTPHCTKPLLFTASRVAPACAKPLVPKSVAAPSTARVDLTLIIETSSLLLFCGGRVFYPGSLDANRHAPIELTEEPDLSLVAH